jgi:hypothetical protein
LPVTPLTPMPSLPATTAQTSGRGRRRAPIRARALAVAFAVLLGGPGPVSAEEVPAARQVLIVLRALAYDSNLKTRAGETINIAVMHRKANSASERSADDITQAFKTLQSTLVAGLPIDVTHLPYSGSDSLKKAILGLGIDLLYVCEGLDGEIDTIKEITRDTSVLSVGTQRTYVERGLSFGVFELDGKNTILLNLPASRHEGAAFASDLLRLAKVLR